MNTKETIRLLLLLRSLIQQNYLHKSSYEGGLCLVLKDGWLRGHLIWSDYEQLHWYINHNLPLSFRIRLWMSARHHILYSYYPGFKNILYWYKHGDMKARVRWINRRIFIERIKLLKEYVFTQFNNSRAISSSRRYHML